MIVTHVKPESWVDTNEVDVIQPSGVAGLVHVVELEAGDLLQGPAGPAGPQGVQGLQGLKGDTGAAGGGVAGMVAFFAMAVAPAGWLACHGGAVSRADYSALFAAVGTLFGAGDGVTTFNLPDLRGEFLRGVDAGRGVDEGRSLGSFQGDAYKAHSHDVYRWKEVGSGSVRPTFGSGATGSVVAGVTAGGGGGAETRPRNIALLACISTGA